MTITMAQALQFNKLYNLIKNKSCSIQTAYKLSVIHSETSNKNDFYNMTLQNIVKDCCEIDDAGKPKYNENGTDIIVKKEKQEDWIKRISELVSLPVEIKEVYFGLEELETLDLKVSEIQGLMPFIKIEQNLQNS